MDSSSGNQQNVDLPKKIKNYKFTQIERGKKGSKMF